MSQGKQCLQKIAPENKWTHKYKYISIYILGGSKFVQIAVYIYLLKTELWISDFQHFHWLARHRLSAHMPALPNMVNEHTSK